MSPKPFVPAFRVPREARLERQKVKPPCHIFVRGDGTANHEGYFIGTNADSMTGPNGETILATGKRVRARECDAATVKNGVVTSHGFY